MNHRSVRLAGIAGIGILSLSLEVPVANAQAAPQSANSGDQLQEVVVTAERRSEDIQKTPIPITVVTGADIQAKGQTQIDQVLRDVPSVQIQSSPVGSDVIIRALGGNDTGGISQDPDVSVFEDGVYSSQSAQNISTIYDVNRMEVLRGPQGTLYGRNSAGGAVNILTNDPTSQFGGGVNVGYGNYDARHIDGYVNLPATDQLAFRLAFDRDLRNGYYSNGGGALDSEGLRWKAKWTPNDALTVLARVEYQRQKGLNETTAPLASAPGPFAPANPDDPYNTEGVSPPGIAGVTAVWNKNEFLTYSIQADWNLGFGVLTVLPTYSTSSQEQSSASLFVPTAFAPPPYSIGTTTTGQTTFEARLASEPDSAIKWVGGVFGLRSNANQGGAIPGGVANTFYAQQSNNRRPASSYAAFAQATLPFTERLRGTAGVRYTVDEKSVFYGVCSSTDGINCGPSATGAGTFVSPPTNITSRYTSFTYTAGVDYDLTSAAMGYAKISTGYKAGGYSTATFPPVAYAPEKLIDYELGIKSQMLDNRLQVNADLYLYQYKDQQIELHEELPAIGIIPTAYIPAADLGSSVAGIVDVNAGNSQFYGAEAQAQYQLTSHDLIGVQAAYERAKYGSFVIPIDEAAQPPGAGYGTATSFDLSGQTEAHAPMWSGNISYQHIWDVGSGSLTFKGTSRFQTWSYTTIQQWFADGNTIQPSYHKTDLTLHYSAQGDRWGVGAWVNNLENKATVNYVYPFYKQTLDLPRMYGINASFKY